MQASSGVYAQLFVEASYLLHVVSLLRTHEMPGTQYLNKGVESINSALSCDKCVPNGVVDIKYGQDS